MTDHGNDQKRRKQLDSRLEKAARERPGITREGAGARTGISIALKMTTELVAAVFIGVLIGLGLDHLTGWSPLFLIVFFVTGAIAGFLNVIRASEALDDTGGAAENSVQRDDGE